MLKDPFDIVLYQMLLWELKPRTIFEFGAYCGGSACWMGDLLVNYGIDGHVYSVDIDLSLFDENAQHQKVTFIEGDSNQIKQLLSRDFLKTCFHPWLIIEDAHTTLCNLINALNPELVILGGGISKVGDFLLTLIVPEVKERVLIMPKFAISALHDEASVIGALAYLREHTDFLTEL